MVSEELEFQISQYLDGTLPAEEIAALEAHLKGDAEARELLGEYRKLNQIIVADGPQLPALNWDQLATSISTAVMEQQTPVVVARIGLGQSTWTRQRVVAIAASMVIVAGISISLFFQSRGTTNNKSQPSGEVAVLGPQAEQANGKAIEEISIGPSPALAAQIERGNSWRVADGVVSRPSKVVLAGMVTEDSIDSHIR